MLTLLKPIILSFVKTQKFKIFVIELLEKLVEQTDNELDAVSYTHLRSPRDVEESRMPSSA